MDFPQLLHILWKEGGDLLNFIFPQNYNFKPKLLGVLDYSTAIFNIIWYIIVLALLNFFTINLKIKIFLFIFMCFPLFLFSMVGFNGENIFHVLMYMLKYIIRPKVYVFDKVPRKVF